MKYDISNLDINSVDQLAELIKKVFNKEVKKDNLKRLINNENVIDIIAKEGDKVIGHAMVEIRYDFFTNEKFYYLNYFCVEASYRCHGIGNNLLRKIEELASEQNINYMMFTSGNKRIDAHRFYENRGYIIKDTSVFIKHFSLK